MTSRPPWLSRYMELNRTRDLGAEILGYVETYFGDWYGVIDVATLIAKNYDLFACLFGVANFANFRPLFPSRGLPADASATVLESYEQGKDYFFGATWATLDELRAI